MMEKLSVPLRTWMCGGFLGKRPKGTGGRKFSVPHLRCRMPKVLSIHIFSLLLSHIACYPVRGLWLVEGGGEGYPIFPVAGISNEKRLLPPIFVRKKSDSAMRFIPISTS